LQDTFFCFLYCFNIDQNKDSNNLYIPLPQYYSHTYDDVNMQIADHETILHNSDDTISLTIKMRL